MQFKRQDRLPRHRASCTLEVQQPLRLFQGLQIFQSLARMEAAGDGFRTGNLQRLHRDRCRRQARMQPDIPQPPLDEQQQIRTVPAIFRFDGGSQFVLPIYRANLFRRRLVFFERRYAP